MKHSVVVQMSMVSLIHSLVHLVIVNNTEKYIKKGKGNGKIT